MSKKKTYIKIDKPIEVGDLVRCVEERGGGHPVGQVRKVRSTNCNKLWLLGCALPHYEEFWEPVRKGSRVSENRRTEMERAVAEMIVELLDQAKAVSVFSQFVAGNRTAIVTDKGHSAATLAPNDVWDTLTGVYVALSKATGRKLPDWIYGEVK